MSVGARGVFNRSYEPLLFEVEDAAVHGIDTDYPSISFRHEGTAQTLHCDVIAGCDGFHGVCREAIPESVLRVYGSIPSPGSASWPARRRPRTS